PNAQTPDASDAPAAFRSRSADADDGMSWARSSPVPPPPEPEMVPVPTPRRPTSPQPEQDSDWGAPPPPPPPVARPSRQAPKSSEPAPAPPAVASREAPLAAAIDQQSLEEFIRHLAHGAGVAPEVFAAKNPTELAEYLGGLVRLVVENVRQLLDARLQAKQ